MVDFLVARKFPEFQTVSSWSTFLVLWKGGSTTSLSDEKISGIEEYATALKRKPFDELRALWQEEVEKYKQAIEHQISMEEVLHNGRMGTKPDYVFWSKKPDWTLDEAITLILERDPASINWETIKHFVSHDRFAEKYAEVRNLVLRAKQGRQLNNPTIPSKFMDWAKRFEMECPEELVAQVENHRILTAELKKKHNKLYGQDRLLGENLDIENVKQEQYSPKLAREKARKQATQAKYQRWQKEYRRLKKEHPSKSIKWCSIQISKMDIAGDAAPEYIRRIMKK